MKKRERKKNIIENGALTIVLEAHTPFVQKIDR